MINREKVIEGLKEIVDSDWMWRKADYWALICKNALALLEEQEPMKPIVTEGAYDDDFPGATLWYSCGECSAPIDYKDKYCWHCGRAVKWDG